MATPEPAGLRASAPVLSVPGQWAPLQLMPSPMRSEGQFPPPTQLCVVSPEDRGAAESWGEGSEEGFSRIWQLKNAGFGEVTCGGTGWALLLSLLSPVTCLQQTVWTAEVSHLREAFFHSFCILGGRGLFAAVEARDAGRDVLGLGVVADTTPVGHHRPIAARHLHGCGHRAAGEDRSVTHHMFHPPTSLAAPCIGRASSPSPRRWLPIAIPAMALTVYLVWAWMASSRGSSFSESSQQPVVSDGFHKTQCLRSGRWNVVRPALLESANGWLRGRREFLRWVCSRPAVGPLDRGIGAALLLLNVFCNRQTSKP